MTFFKTYLWFVVIAFVLFLASSFFYRRAMEDPLQAEREISDVLKNLDHQTESEQRQIILAELIRAREESLNRQWYEHLAEALLLAGTMIVTAEGVTRYLSSKEISENTGKITGEIRDQAERVSQNVWNAIFQRLVPNEIATEVKKILKSDVCRIRPEYTVVLTNGNYVDIPEGYIVVKRRLYYRLLNLTGGQIETTVPLQLYDPVGDRQLTTDAGSKVTLPRICELKVNRVTVPIPPEKRTAFEHTFNLPKMDAHSEAIEIYSEVEGLSLATDRSVYSLSAPCYDLQLSVVNEIPDRTRVLENNVYVSSGEGRLHQKTSSSWSCEGGLLPGCALAVSWKELPVTPGKMSTPRVAEGRREQA